MIQNFTSYKRSQTVSKREFVIGLLIISRIQNKILSANASLKAVQTKVFGEIRLLI
mgnify:CR=1 FL=1